MEKTISYLFVVLATVSQCFSFDCPSGYIYRSDFDRCYKFVVVPQGYQQAEQFCANVGAHLATVQSKAENDYIGSTAATNFGASTTFWIGMDDLSGQWKWLDGEPTNYLNWASGQPSNGGFCATGTTSSGYQWKSAQCYSPVPFVCEFERPPTTPPPTTVTKAPCDSQWTYQSLFSSCYYVGTSTSFWSAESMCTALGAHLTSITNAFENSFIQGLTTTGTNATSLDQMTWIGAHYGTGKWIWTDGSPFSYTNWLPGSPSQPKKDECVEFLQDNYPKKKEGQGYWTNNKCTDTMRRFVCKKPAMV